MKPRHQKNCQQNQNPSVSSLSEFWAKISPNSAKIENLLPDQRANLLRSLEELDLSQLQSIRSNLQSKKKMTSFSPITEALIPNDELILCGQKQLKREKVGVLVLAGGQGSRLGTAIPKGMFPLTPLKKRSLFQIFAEDILAAQKEFGKSISLTVMTSLATQTLIENFFTDHRFWGLDPAHVHFFPQGVLPLLDLQADPQLTSDGSIATAPNGNGGIFHALGKSKVMEKLNEKKIDYLMVIPIDNALADPVNPALIGAVATVEEPGKKENHRVCFKVVKRRSFAEKTGMFVQQSGKLRVLEYTDQIPKTSEQDSKVSLNDFGLANTGEFCIAWPFAKILSEKKLTHWPLHVVKKNIVESKGNQVNRIAVLKTEFFNFDLIQWTSDVQLMKFDRFSTFAPLKDSSGRRGPKRVSEILSTLNLKNKL